MGPLAAMKNGTPVPSAMIEHRPLRVAYADAGSGPPVVLLHPVPLDRTMWGPQLDKLSEFARVLAMDLPGFGESGELVQGYTVDALADVTADFLDAIGV